MNRLFGTDGIRGLAGEPPLIPAQVVSLGCAAGQVLKEKEGSGPIRVLIVRDTRASGKGLLSNLSKGLQQAGIDVFNGGVLNTPSVAYLVGAHRLQSGVVISASHNPPEFNGIKFFNKQGRKWPYEWENLIEKKLRLKLSPTPVLGKELPAGTFALDYENFLVETLGQEGDFSGYRLAVDCANGANFQLAPRVFSRLGAEVTLHGGKPNGRNINVGCGSQNPSFLAELVKKSNRDVGIAFDGDGDRVIFVDEKGNIIDGDFVIASLAQAFKTKGILKKHTAVITVMANLGLRRALAKMKIRTIEVPVGDRHVSEAMHKSGAVLGGEQSGHIILGHHLPTGDGLLTALHVLAAFRHSPNPFSKWVGCMKKFPQVLKNVPVKAKTPLSELKNVENMITKIENRLGDQGRVLVRYSGTEPLLRIMLEGPNKGQIEKYASQIEEAVLSSVQRNGFHEK